MRISKRFILASALAAFALRRFYLPGYDLSGKSVLIMGGSRGLGLALAREFAARGARLTLVARDADELRRAQADLKRRGAEVSIFAGDVTVPQDVDEAVRRAVAEYGTLDVAVHCAGIIQNGPLHDMTAEDWRGIMEVNAFGALELARAAHPYLKAAQGRMLIIASVGGKVAVPHLGPYTMSKFAVSGLGQALDAELGRDGIRVTTAHPGLMQTGSPRNAQIKGDFEAEYTFFATLDNLPLISMPADDAARRIVNALVRGDSQAVIGLPAQLMTYANTLAPQLVADSMRLTNSMLPGPTGSTEMRYGAEAETDITRNNPIKRAAEERFNENGEFI